MLMDIQTDLKQQEIKELNWQLDLITFHRTSTLPNK